MCLKLSRGRISSRTLLCRAVEMKIKDLIKKLQEFDPDTVVVTRGFDEYGFADIQTVEPVRVRLRKSKHSRDTFGEYEAEESGSGRGRKVVLIDH